MAGTRFFQLLPFISLVLAIYHLKSCNANVQTNHYNLIFLDFDFDFEQIKNELFLQSDFNNIDMDRGYDLKNVLEHLKCFKEMLAIQRGLKKFEKWAMKIVDAWGKLPSGIFSGNNYEFGDFVECLNIERNGTRYKTQYCLGQLIFDMGNKPTKLFQFATKDINFPANLQFEEKRKVEQRMLLEQAPNALSINFGMCLPDICSPHLFESIINSLILKNGSKVSVKFSNDTCQFEETPSELDNLDVLVICILVLISCLIIVSTCYDILFTNTNRVKSQALVTFSFYSNGLKLLSYKKSKSPDMMHCLHGIRVISTMWVVLGHIFSMYALLPLRNKIVLLTFIQQYHNMFIFSAVISVDTFFFMSGLLVSVNLLKHFEKTNGRINIPLFYFHRYLRLTPLLSISFLFTMSLLKFLGSGPLYPMMMDVGNEPCKTYWWTTLLYIQNYVNPKKICFVHSWYLSVDMQLFVFSPAIVYLIYKFKIKILPILWFLILCCIGCTLAVRWKYDITHGISLNHMDKTYFPTHIRFSPWLIGVMEGYALFEARKRSIRIPKLFNLFAWAASLAIMAAIIFTNYPLVQIDSNATPLMYGLYDALSRVGWAISLSYIVFACVHNFGGPVNWFLSHPLWQPLSRLCYSIYIIHFPIIVVLMASMKSSLYFSEMSAYHTFFGTFVITVFVSIITTLAFESPIVIIEKLIFASKKSSTVNNNAELNVPQNERA